MNTAASVLRSIENISPFRRSPESRTAIATTVRGEMPSWLRGELVRTCPAVFEATGWRAQHWFDGLGMIYAFQVGGSSVTFRSRLLDCETAQDALKGKASLGTFGTPLARTLWRRILEPVPRITDNTNVNILRMGDDLVAMTESDRQFVIDDTTLAPLGNVTYAGDRLGSAIMSAHPHFDFDRGRVVNVATKIGASGAISIYEHEPTARRRDVVGSWRTSRVPYIHSFGLTPAHAVLVAHPFTVKPIDMLWSNRGYIEHFDWRPQEGTRLIVMDRTTGATREHLTDPLFVFHTVNAFERDGATVLDLLAYSNPDIVSDLQVDRMAEQLPDLRPSLLRISMRPGWERATVERLSESGFEFPSTNYKRVNGRDYRFAWGASDGPQAGGGYASSIVKVDVRTGASTSFADDVHVFGEPVFVARPQGSDEDDGVLVTVGSRKDTDTSVLAIIDAKTMAFVASAEVPHAIPLGFHGSFVRKSA